MNPSYTLEQRIRGELTRWDAEGLSRTLRPPAGIDLSSNDYLGLATHPLLRQTMAATVMRDGCGSTGSRLLRGERLCFAQLESRFARFKSLERALYFSSGYLANLAVLSTFPQAGDVIYSDERNHASLIDGIRLSRADCRVFPHNDVMAVARLLNSETAPGQKFIVTESLFSMDGDFAPLPAYAELCRSSGALLIVDEAHAVGIYGCRGSGLIEATGAHAFISVDTAGKALGVSGAFVSGPEWAIEYLIQRARPFVFSTATPPPIAAALEVSLTLIQTEPWLRRQVLSRACYLRARLAEAGISIPAGDSQIIPVVIGENEPAVEVAETLRQQGFDVRAIRPPSVPRGTARLRISVNANLTEEILRPFAKTLAGALRGSSPSAQRGSNLCPAVCS